MQRGGAGNQFSEMCTIESLDNFSLTAFSVWSGSSGNDTYLLGDCTGNLEAKAKTQEKLPFAPKVEK